MNDSSVSNKQRQTGDSKMTILDTAKKASVTNRSVDERSTGPWDNPALAKFREWERYGSINASKCPQTRGPAAYCRAKTLS
jgi:hypothetical protein